MTMTGQRGQRATDLFDEYLRRRRGGQSPAEVIVLMRQLSGGMVDIERQRLINLIREWERAQGDTFMAVPPTSQEIRTISPQSQFDPYGAGYADNGHAEGAHNGDSDTDMRPPYVGSGTQQFTGSTLLCLHIGGYDDPIIIAPGNETMIGCGGTGSILAPDVDLTPYEGLQLGVAPLHMTLRRYQDALVIASVDGDAGAYLNGEPLYPGQPRPLHDGDQMRLGQLTLWVQFKNPFRRVGAA